MVRLDIAGVVFTLFLLGPRNWRWSLAAIGVGKLATLLILVLWRVPLAAYTMGGMFTQVDLEGGGVFSTLVITLTGPFCCYTVARLATSSPLGDEGWWNQLLPWSELSHPMAATFAKYALLSGLFGVGKLIF